MKVIEFFVLLNFIMKLLHSVSNYTGVLNRLAGFVAMLTWYQGNFIRLLKRLAGSEAMSG